MKNKKKSKPVCPGTVVPGTVTLHKQADMLKCPFAIMMPEHYRNDGKCLCTNKKHRENVMVAEWEYTEEDFKNIPLLDQTMNRQKVFVNDTPNKCGFCDSVKTGFRGDRTKHYLFKFDGIDGLFCSTEYMKRHHGIPLDKHKHER